MEFFLLIGIMLLLIFLGMPVVFTVGISGLILLIFLKIPLTTIPSLIFSELDSFSFVAIPLFILAAELLNEGSLTDRIIDFSKSIVGNIRGGLAHVNIFASMLFGGISGSTTADTAAIGSALIPAMERSGYHKDFSVAVTITSSLIGGIIPPSVMMIVFGSLTNVSIGKLFLGGVIPGILVGLALMITSYIISVKRNYIEKEPFSWARIIETGKKTIWATLVPLVIIVGIAGGFTTASEAGVLAVFSALLIGRFVYKELNSLAKLKKVFVNTGLTTSMIMLLLGFSALFGEALTRIGFQEILSNFLLSISTSPLVSMVIIVLIVFVLGMFIDTVVVLTLFSIPFMEIAVGLGYDPIHFGIIMVMTALMSPITPPLGVLLFLGSSIAQTRVVSILRIQSVFTLTFLVTILAVVIFPGLATYLPNFFLE